MSLFSFSDFFEHYHPDPYVWLSVCIYKWPSPLFLCLFLVVWREQVNKMLNSLLCLSDVNLPISKHIAAMSGPMACVEKFDPVVPCLNAFELAQSSFGMQVQTSKVNTSSLSQERPWASITSSFSSYVPGHKLSLEWSAAVVSASKHGEVKHALIYCF